MQFGCIMLGAALLGLAAGSEDATCRVGDSGCRSRNTVGLALLQHGRKMEKAGLDETPTSEMDNVGLGEGENVDGDHQNPVQVQYPEAGSSSIGNAPRVVVNIYAGPQAAPAHPPSTTPPPDQAPRTHPEGPIPLSGQGSGSILDNRWSSDLGWTGVRGDDTTTMCASGDNDRYAFKVFIESGQFHQVGVAPSGCCTSVDTSKSDEDSKFAALFSKAQGWNRHRGAAQEVGVPTTSTWWDGYWNLPPNFPQTVLVRIDCNTSKFQVGIEGGDSYLGEMSWPHAWNGVYPFVGQQAWRAPGIYRLEWNPSGAADWTSPLALLQR